MENMGTFLRGITKKNSRILFIIYLFFSMVGLFILMKNNLIRYATDDDFVMTLAVSGAYGEYSPYMLYSNAFLGVLVSWLFKLLPIVNWITVFQVLGFITFFLVIGYFLISKASFQGLILAIGFEIVSIPYVWNLNYSKTAAIVTLTGTILFIDSLSKRGKTEVIVSVILITYGIMIRREPALLILPFSALGILGVEGCFRDIAKRKRLIIASIVAVLAFVGFAITNNCIDDLSMYNEIDALSTQLRDYGMPDYEGNVEKYQSIGVSLNDYNMQNSLHYGDTSVLSPSILKKINDIKGNTFFSKSRLLEALRIFKEEILHYELLILGLILSGILIVLLPSRKAWCILGMAALAMAEILYMLYIGRWPLRVLFIPMISLIAVASYMGIDELSRLKAANKYGVTAAILAFCILGSGVANWEQQDGFGGGKEETYALIDFLREQDRNLYIWDTSSPKIYDLYNPYQMIDRGILSNIAFDCGWEVELPANIHKVLEYMDEYNVYKNSVNSNIYFVGDEAIEIKRDYIREHYHPYADYSVVNELYGERILSFSDNFDINSKKDIDWEMLEVSSDENYMDIICQIDSSELTDAEKVCIELSSEKSSRKFTYELGKREEMAFSAKIPLSSWSDADDIVANLVIQKQNETIEAKKSALLKMQLLEQY